MTLLTSVLPPALAGQSSWRTSLFLWTYLVGAAHRTDTERCRFGPVSRKSPRAQSSRSGAALFSFRSHNHKCLCLGASRRCSNVGSDPFSAGDVLCRAEENRDMNGALKRKILQAGVPRLCAFEIRLQLSTAFAVITCFAWRKRKRPLVKSTAPVSITFSRVKALTAERWEAGRRSRSGSLLCSVPIRGIKREQSRRDGDRNRQH